VFLQKQTTEIEVATQSVTCDPNKEPTRSRPRDVSNIDMSADAVPSDVSYPHPPIVFFFDNIVTHIGLNLQFIDLWCCNPCV